MTLSSRHRIRNSSPGGLRPSTLPLGHRGSPQYWLSHVDGEETFFVYFKPPRPGTEPQTLAWKAAVLTTTLGPPLVVAVTKEAHDVSNQQDEQTDQWEQSWGPHRHWKQTNSSTSVNKISDLSELKSRHKSILNRDKSIIASQTLPRKKRWNGSITTSITILQLNGACGYVPQLEIRWVAKICYNRFSLFPLNHSLSVKARFYVFSTKPDITENSNQKVIQ